MSNDINAIVQEMKTAAILEQEYRNSGGFMTDGWNDVASIRNIILIIDALEAEQKRNEYLESWRNEAEETLVRLAAFLQVIGIPHAVNWRDWIDNAEKKVMHDQRKIAELESTPVPVVLDEMKYPRRPLPRTYQIGVDVGRVDGWNAYRAAILSTSPAQPDSSIGNGQLLQRLEKQQAESNGFPHLAAIPETLPCNVLLEPGFRLRKGVTTSTLITALNRRAEYERETENATPKETERMKQSLDSLMTSAGFQKVKRSVYDPEKWKLVPIKSTPEMIQAARVSANDLSVEVIDGAEITYVHHEDIYDVMVAASPVPEGQ
ncbi:hypothetical protein LPW36_02120 [Jinshanibacter sp. LJY008]|uniref:Uncharacterized protein n=1 Tax=Limnobaculum eriocheiris TaxID=2897391 RepID=A0A9X1MSR5_9GAMM|nr:hypothetical protein [Limnobaculum eriocheiris]MCD1124841.1 hypothetical protein [Limnobaculum eriocheiris]